MSVSDENQSNEVSSEANESKPEFSKEDLLAEIENLKSTNARLLDESYKAKHKYKEVESKYNELDSIRKESMSKDELLAEKEKELASISKKLEEERERLFISNVKSSLVTKAKDAYNVEALLGMDKYIGLLKQNEEGTDVTEDSVNQFITELREKEPYLFGRSKIPSMDVGKPQMNKVKEDVSKMDSDQYLAHVLKKLKAQGV